MPARNTIAQARTTFAKYLQENRLRKTPERFTILAEIYKRDDHFDAEALYLQIQAKKFHISKATVYNTLDTLVSCDLVIKHQFGKNLTQYEKSYGYKQHDHIICISCNKVVEFCDPRIQPIKSMMGELLDFQITDHSLNLFGLCGDCQRKQSGTRRVKRTKKLVKQ